MLRSGALNEPEVIALIEASFVPVWINVRTTPLPRRGWVGDVLYNSRVDGENKITDLFSEGFFIRSVALSPDGETLLNTKSKTIGGSLMAIAQGDHGYAITDSGDYLVMLRDALEKMEQKTKD